MIKVTNFDTFKCRCSAIAVILANAQGNLQLTARMEDELKELESKESLKENQKKRLSELLVRKENGNKIVLGATCIKYLMEWYSWETVGKIPVDKEAMDIEYTKKGTTMEADSIKLLSIVDGEIYEKNTDGRIQNEYLSGIPDIYLGENIMSATKIIDVKSIWDYPSFLNKTFAPLELNYQEQIQGYCDITGAKEGELTRCLVDMPEEIITDYQYRLLKKMNLATTESPEFVKEWQKWENSMRFGDIPPHQRVFKIKVEPFTEEERQRVYDRVKYCREWLWNFDEQYKELNN